MNINVLKLWAISVGVIAAVLLRNAYGDDDQKVYDQFKRSVAQLTGYCNGQPTTGTGFLIKQATKRSILITNYHVVRGLKTLSARLPDTDYIDCLLVDTKPDYDLAAVALKEGVERDRDLVLPEDQKETPQPGTPVVMIGSPLGLASTIHPGIVSGPLRKLSELFQNPVFNPNGLPLNFPDQQVIQLNITSTYGMSGAPVLAKEKGWVIGVQKEGWKDGLGGINFCIPHFYVAKLDLAKEPVDFVVKGGPRLTDNFVSYGLKKQNLKVMGRDNGREVEFGCRTWGYVPNDPQFVYTKYVGDKSRFGRMITPGLLQQLLTRNRVVHVTNPFFRFAFLVPDNYTVTEEAQPNFFGLKVILTNKDAGVPANLNRITIDARRAPRCPHPALNENINTMVRSFAINRLHLPLAYPGGPALPGLVPFDPGNSDPAPRIDPLLQRARYQVLFNWPTANRSHAIYAAIDNETLLVTDFEFATHPQTRGTLDPDFAERLFIAESVSFFPETTDKP